MIDQGDVTRNWQSDKIGTPEYVPPEQRNDPPRSPLFTVAGNDIYRWTHAKDAWLYGYWYFDWADQTMQLDYVDPQSGAIKGKQASHYGVKAGQRFFVYNLLEELDSPGEWYIDRDKGILFLYPTSDSPDAELDLLTSTEPLVTVNDASYIAFKGLTFEGGRGDGIIVKNSSNLLITSSTITKIAGDAVTVRKGSNVGVTNSHIFNIGKSGITLDGGSRPTLTPGGHYAENNYIHTIGVIQKTFVYGVYLTGVGNRALHNEIFDSPFMAIWFDGNDQIMNYNHIYDVAKESDDVGAIGSGRNWTWRGNQINYNFIHDIKGRGEQSTWAARAVMLDDMLSGTEVRGNVFYNVQSGVSINGGRDNIVENNIFVNNGLNGKPTIALIDRSNDPDTGSLTPGTGMMYTALNEVPYQNELWTSKYPKLATILQENPKEPRGNSIRNNVAVDSTRLSFPQIAISYGNDWKQP